MGSQGAGSEAVKATREDCKKILIVRKDCDAIPSSSDCLFCLFFLLSSFKSSFVENWFSVYFDDITSGVCFVVEIVGAGVASSEENKID